MKVHMKSDLHVWSAEKDEIVKTERKTLDEENKEVGKTVILMYLKNAQRSGSSVDFLNNIDFTHLLKGSSKVEAKTKRDTESVTVAGSL